MWGQKMPKILVWGHISGIIHQKTIQPANIMKTLAILEMWLSPVRPVSHVCLFYRSVPISGEERVASLLYDNTLSLYPWDSNLKVFWKGMNLAYIKSSSRVFKRTVRIENCPVIFKIWPQDQHHQRYLRTFHKCKPSGSALYPVNQTPGNKKHPSIINSRSGISCKE